MGKVVSFINMKGGVAKTTTAVNIGYTLATEYHQNVLLIDADPQASATEYILDNSQIDHVMKPENTLLALFDRDHADEQIIFPIHEQFHLIPSHQKLIDQKLDNHPFRLKEYIDKLHLKETYDLILIDCPPTPSGYTTLALLSSDSFLVPSTAEPMAIHGIPKLLAVIHNLKKDKNLEKPKLLGLLLTKVQPHRKVYRDAHQQLKEWDYQKYLFKEELKERTEISRAVSSNRKKAGNQFMINMKNLLIQEEIKRISMEFSRKVENI